MAEILAEPGVMQPEAGLWSKVSIAGLAGVRAATCTSQSGRLGGNVGAMVCPGACPHGPPPGSAGH